jgi:hypothetical protein
MAISTHQILKIVRISTGLNSMEPNPVIHVRSLADLHYLTFLANPDTDPAFHVTKINLYGACMGDAILPSKLE